MVAHYIKCLRRQNLTTLCTTAGQNLTAVGSSHSLTETVDLGSVATAGLIGTLHIRIHLLSNHICSTAQFAAATHNNRPYMVMLRYYNRKIPFGQPPIFPGVRETMRTPFGRVSFLIARSQNRGKPVFSTTMIPHLLEKIFPFYSQSVKFQGFPPAAS